MDFIYRVTDSVNSIPQLPLNMRTGYLGAKESLVISPLPGSSKTQVYMDGAEDVNQHYEIAMKSKDGDRVEKTLWLISDYLDQLEDVSSQDNSFTFNDLTITSKPFIEGTDEQGWFTFSLNFTANITKYKERT